MKKLFLLTAFLYGILLPPLSSYASVTGLAEIKGTQKDSPISGMIFFEETSEGLKIFAEISHVPPGKHGFHIHEKGSCENGGRGAGRHFNPNKTSHGLLMRDGVKHAHAGDFGNIEALEDGVASLNITLPGLTLQNSKYAVGGLAVILHEREDYLDPPEGDAGPPIACGVIEVD